MLNVSYFVFINDQRRCSNSPLKKFNYLCFCIEHLLWSFMNTKSGVFNKKSWWLPFYMDKFAFLSTASGHLWTQIRGVQQKILLFLNFYEIVYVKFVLQIILNNHKVVSTIAVLRSCCYIFYPLVDALFTSSNVDVRDLRFKGRICSTNNSNLGVPLKIFFLDIDRTKI